MYNRDVPTPEEIGAQYQGLTYEAFRQLPDKDVEQLRQGFNEQLGQTKVFESNADGDMWFSEPGMAIMEEREVLENFTKWRKHGIPDRELSRDDIKAYAIDALQGRRNKAPEYGTIPGSHFEGWTKDEREAAKGILWYCYQGRGVSKPPFIDTHSLGDILEGDNQLLDAMIDKGVLLPVPEGGYDSPDGRQDVFYLGRPYLDNFFAQVVTWSMNQ